MTFFTRPWIIPSVLDSLLHLTLRFLKSRGISKDNEDPGGNYKFLDQEYSTSKLQALKRLWKGLYLIVFVLVRTLGHIGTNNDKATIANKTYLDYATGKVPPKKARKFKKLASPKLKTVPASPKEPTQKGKRLLSDAALLEDAQLKKTLRKSKRETHKLQASGSSEGVNFESKVPDEQTSKTKDISKGTDVIPRVPDVSKEDSSDMVTTKKKNSDDEEKMYEEEDDDVAKELYGDLNITQGLRDSNMTNDEQGTMQSSSVSSNFTSKLLNLDNTGPDINEIASLVNTSTVPPSPPPVNPSSHLTTTPQQQIPDSTTTTTNPTITLPEILNFASLFRFEQRVSALETKYSEFNQTSQFAEVLKEEAKAENQEFFNQVDSTMKAKIKEHVKAQVSKIMPQIKKYVTESMGDEVGQYDQDKDEDPSARSDRGTKRRKSSKDAEPSKGLNSKESKSSSSSRGTQSKPKSLGKSTQVEEPEFEAADTEIQMTLDKPPTPDRAWNKSKSIDSRPPQKWISTIAKARQPPRTFDELMDTPIDFSAYVMNQCYKAVNDRLDWHNPEGHEDPFDLSKPLPLIEDQGRQVVPTNYFINNNLEYLKGGSSSSKYVTSTTRTKATKYDNIEGIEDMVPTLWSPVKFKEGDFPRLNLCDIKDMLLLLVQKKLSNLDVDDRYDL
ncbi:hypothetical protein Tco_1158959, partial [Tanacetum coccineum]